MSSVKFNVLRCWFPASLCSLFTSVSLFVFLSPLAFLCLSINHPLCICASTCLCKYHILCSIHFQDNTGLILWLLAMFKQAFNFSLSFSQQRFNCVMRGVQSDGGCFMNVWGGLGSVSASSQWKELNKSETQALQYLYTYRHKYKCAQKFESRRWSIPAEEKSIIQPVFWFLYFHLFFCPSFLFLFCPCSERGRSQQVARGVRRGSELSCLLGLSQPGNTRRCILSQGSV